MNIHEITLDVSKTPAHEPSLYIGQGDKNGTTLKVNVYDNGTALTLTGMTVKFSMRNPGMADYYEVAGTVSGNVASFLIDETYAASHSGVTDVAYVSIMDSGNVTSTSRLRVVVLPGAKDGVVPAPAYASEVEQFLEDAQEQLDEAIAEISLDGYATEDYVDAAIADIDIPTDTSDLTNGAGYQTASDVATAISGKANTADLGTAAYATVETTGVSSDTSTLPTTAQVKDYVDTAIADIDIDCPFELVSETSSIEYDLGEMRGEHTGTYSAELTASQILEFTAWNATIEYSEQQGTTPPQANLTATCDGAEWWCNIFQDDVYQSDAKSVNMIAWPKSTGEYDSNYGIWLFAESNDNFETFYAIDLALGRYVLDGDLVVQSNSDTVYAATDNLRAWDKIIDKPELYTKAQIDAKGYQNATQVSTAIDTAIQALGTPLDYKGSVSTYADLPNNAQTGDVYNVLATDENYAWTGSAWDKFGTAVDLSSYYTKTEVDTSQASQDALIEKSWKDVTTGAGVNLLPMQKALTGTNAYQTTVPTFDGEWVVSDGVFVNMKLAHFGTGNNFYRSLLDSNKKYTMLVEVYGMPSGSTPTIKTSLSGQRRDDSPTALLYYASESAISGTQVTLFDANTEYVDGAASARVLLEPNRSTNPLLSRMQAIVIADTLPQGVKIRCSIYEGDYQGDYVPYDYDQPLPMKHRVSDLESTQATQDSIIAANADGVGRAWKEGINLEPFFDVPLDDVQYWCDDENYGFFVDGGTATTLSNGWVHYEATDATALFFPIANLSSKIDTSTSKTLMIEFANVSVGNGNIVIDFTEDTASEGKFAFTNTNGETITSNGTYYIKLTPTGDTNPPCLCNLLITGNSVAFHLSYDIRLSLYEGEYTGNYVPYDFDQPSQVKKRLAAVEDGVERAWKDGVEPVNLHPFFSAYKLSSFFSYLGGAVQSYSSDGWARFGQSANANTYIGMDIYNLNQPIEKGERYTLLVEFDDVTTITGIQDNPYITIENYSTDIELIDGDIELTPPFPSSVRIPCIGNESVPTGEAFGCWIDIGGVYGKIRMSLYKGNYTGEYIPYDFNSPLSAKTIINDELDTIAHLIGVVIFDANDGAFNEDDSCTKLVANFIGSTVTALTGNEMYGPSGTETLTAWTTNQNGTGSSYAPGDPIDIFLSTITLYAQWEAV